MFTISKQFKNVGYFLPFDKNILLLYKNEFQILDEHYRQLVNSNVDVLCNIPVWTNKYVAFSNGDGNGNGLIVIDQNCNLKKIDGVFSTMSAMPADMDTIFCYEMVNRQPVLVDLNANAFYPIKWEYSPRLIIDRTQAVFGRGSQLFLKDLDNAILWNMDLNSLAPHLPVWKEVVSKKENLTVKSKPICWYNDLIISIGTTFEQRLVSISLSEGTVNWIAKEHNSNGFFNIYKDNAYTMSRNGILVVNLYEGSSNLLSISNKNAEKNFEPGSNFTMSNNYIVCADYGKLAVGILNVDTLEYDFVHQFERGENINSTVQRLGVPQMANGHVFVSDNENTLHILGNNI